MDPLYAQTGNFLYLVRFFFTKIMADGTLTVEEWAENI